MIAIDTSRASDNSTSSTFPIQRSPYISAPPNTPASQPQYPALQRNRLLTPNRPTPSTPQSMSTLANFTNRPISTPTNLTNPSSIYSTPKPSAATFMTSSNNNRPSSSLQSRLATPNASSVYSRPGSGQVTFTLYYTNSYI